MDYRQALAQQYATLGAEELDVSAQHDALLTSWLGIANDFRKVHDYNLVFSGVAVDLTESQVHLSSSLTNESQHSSNNLP